MGVKRRTTITREGFYYLFVLAFIVGGAMMREINLLLAVAGVMIGPVLLGWRTAVRQLRSIDVQRTLPSEIGAGELVAVDITLKNLHSRWPKWAIMIDDRVARTSRQGLPQRRQPRLFFPFTRASESETRTYEGRFYQRGEYHFGPMTLSSGFPMGLIRHTVTLGDQQQLLVYPQLGELTPSWNQLVAPDRVGHQRSRPKRGVTEGEFHGLRDWRIGDSRCWIHWRTSARRNALTVREFEQQQNQDFAVLLDLGQVDWRDEVAAGQAELAVSFVATAVTRQCRVGSSRLTLAIAGQASNILSGSTSMGLSREMMHRLTVAHTTRKDVAPDGLVQFLHEAPRQAKLVYVSTQPVDFSNTERFATIWEDTQRRGMLSRMVTLQVGTDVFDECFHLHEVKTSDFPSN